MHFPMKTENASGPTMYHWRTYFFHVQGGQILYEADRIIPFMDEWVWGQEDRFGFFVYSLYLSLTDGI